ncbi:MAG: hypothetical protein EOP00_30540 [Pedobacter sp.]|nr:MAG: hypothetical protein EOP00_30540 [Pedobacter sp.]
MKQILYLLFLLLSSFASGQNNFTIDTLPNKKVVIKKENGKVLKNAVFDSIVYNAHFTVGYSKHKINIYNNRLKKLSLSNVRAVYLGDFHDAQILQNNKVRKINTRGRDYKIGDGPLFIEHYGPSDAYFPFEITHNTRGFVMQSTEMLILERSFDANEPILLKDTDNVEEFILYTNTNTDVYGNTFVLQIPSDYYVACRMKNGKYNIYSIYNFLPANTRYLKLIDTENLPNDLDAVTGIKGFPKSMFKVERDGLVTYFPISKSVKYKSIETFEGNFARFELPNGKRGWLDIDGNEYLDD